CREYRRISSLLSCIHDYEHQGRLALPKINAQSKTKSEALLDFKSGQRGEDTPPYHGLKVELKRTCRAHPSEADEFITEEHKGKETSTPFAESSILRRHCLPECRGDNRSSESWPRGHRR